MGRIFVAVNLLLDPCIGYMYTQKDFLVKNDSDKVEDKERSWKKEEKEKDWKVFKE